MIQNGAAVKISGVTHKRQTAGYVASALSGGAHSLFYDDGWDKRFTWLDVPRMKRDPMVLMGLRILEAPLHGVKLVSQANSPQVEAFVEKTVTRVWQRALRKIIKMNEFGHMAGENEYKFERGRYRFHQLHAVAPIDARPLRDTASREIVAVRIKSIVGNSHHGETDLMMPNAFWAANEPEYGQPYGQSRLAGAREPWMEKAGRHGANEIRRLWFVKNAFHSGIIRYPIGTTLLPNGDTIDNQDLANELLQKMETGHTLVLPNTRASADGTGDYEWYWEPAAANKDVANLLEYPDKLDELILIGMGIPPEVMEAGVKGSWSGRATTMQMFFSSLDLIATNILDTISRLILKPLVLINFGKKAEFEVLHESLAEQAGQEPETVTEKVQGQDTGGGLGPDPMKDVVGAVRGQPPARRMSLNSIIDDNPELYASIRQFSRGLWPTGGETRLSTGWKEDEHPREDDGTFTDKDGDTASKSKTKKPWEMKRAESDIAAARLAHYEDEIKYVESLLPLHPDFEKLSAHLKKHGADPDRPLSVIGSIPFRASRNVREKASERQRKLATELGLPLGDSDFAGATVDLHKLSVRNALAAGESVSPEVLAEYPEFAPTPVPVTNGDDTPITPEPVAAPDLVPVVPPPDTYATKLRDLYDRAGDTSIPHDDVMAVLDELDEYGKAELLPLADTMELLGMKSRSAKEIRNQIRLKVLDRRSSAQREKMITDTFEEPERLSVVKPPEPTDAELYAEYMAALESE